MAATRVRVTFRRYAMQTKATERHFLLAQRACVIRARDAHAVDSPVVVAPNPDGYSFDVDPDAVSIVELDFSAALTVPGGTFQTLRIVQQFAVPPAGGPGGRVLLVPTLWFTFDASGARTARAVTNGPTPNLHPMLAWTPATSTIQIDALMVDLTDAWFALHGDARWYRRWTATADPSEVVLRVLGCTGGNPLVWFAVVPRQARATASLSPHVFFMPADFGDISYASDTVAGLRDTAHDSAPTLRYLQSAVPDPIAAAGANLESARNLYHVSAIRAGGIRPNHWSIPMGFAKALVGSGAAQVLFVPQRSEGGGNRPAAVGDAVRACTTAALNVLWSHSAAIVTAPAARLDTGKLVLTGYSDSGVSLWSVASTQEAFVKAIIGIEPQNLGRTKEGKLTNKDPTGVNKSGNEVIKQLLDASIKNAGNAPVRVFLIGRHRSHYIVTLGEPYTSKIVFLPDSAHYDGLFGPKGYPPDPTRSDWYRYRVHRLLHPETDPLMDPVEKDLLDAHRRKFPSDEAFLAGIFRPPFNVDKGGGNWFHHHYAVSSGQDMKLPPLDATNAFYGVPVTYRTFFEECLAAIG